ncbi:MAG: hypothetical protein ACOY4K_15180 [Pseudomonadota bacterium]
MKARILVVGLALAGAALAGCGRLGELEAPGPSADSTRRNEEVVDPATSKRTPPEAPIAGTNPDPFGPPPGPQ